MRGVLAIAVGLAGCGSTTCAGPTTSVGGGDAAIDAGGDVTAEGAALDTAIVETSPPYDTSPGDSGAPVSPCSFAVLSSASEKSRTWTACGPGCFEMVAARVGFVGAMAGSAVGSVDGLRTYLRLESGRPGRTTVEVIDDQGNVKFVVEADPTCLLGARGSAFLLPFVDETKLFLAYAGPAAPLTWHGVAVDFPSGNTADFHWSRGFGSAFFGGRVAYLDAPAATMLTNIDPGGAGNVNGAAAYDSQIVYSRTLLERTHVRTYSLGDSVSAPLIEMSTAGLAGLAASATSIVWTGVHGAESTAGRYTAAEFYWTPRVAKAADVKIATGPPLPAKYLLKRVVTSGNYAATIGCADLPPTGCELFVVRMSDARLWRFKARAGRIWTDALSASDQFVIVGEALNTSPAGVMTTVLRLDTTRLNEVAW